ncbi:hypothetical protein BXZ70DRAFT_924936 [Cristinia sonorae]|uniref:Uncharacterized protein n=1 Tax=Cristinia sonorae TaxID=1940300 RepID=A0A8K0UV54_9AGAR|nr:hypothetical protein BXZ70DRAFT_924936 [Cristinia sonorae]
MMVYMLRIQLCGEQARELSADEHRPGPPRHPERLDRLLRRLSLSKPDRTKPVFKSGFFLCYYDEENGGIIRELKRSIRFDQKTKQILVNLNIAYMLLTIVGNRTGVLFDSRIKPRDYDRRSRSRSPPRPSSSSSSNPYRPKTYDRHAHNPKYSLPLQDDRVVVPAHARSSSALQRTDSNASTVPDTPNLLSAPTDTLMKALSVLQNSASMQALLKQDTPGNEVVVKKEESEETSLGSITTLTPSATTASVKRPTLLRDRYAGIRHTPSLERIVHKRSPPTEPSALRKSSAPTPASAAPIAPIAPSSYRTDLSNLMTEALTRPAPKGPSAMVSAKPIQRQTSQEEATLTRELWDVRRQMTALKVKEEELVKQLKHINPAAFPEEQDGGATRTKAATGGQEALTDLEVERKKRKRAEELWEDARRECRDPLVVPAMAEAFERLTRIAGEALLVRPSSATTNKTISAANTRGSRWDGNDGLQSNNSWRFPR